ncbi:polymer-forming cytoskeletal protein [Paenibacillaceae bacterium]|nr:polymer-forming cytoskeletal protein [Paenibacillaceae bacterium]
MFKAKRKTAIETLIGQGTLAEGKLTCESGIHLEGEYHGEIICEGNVLVGEYGLAHCNIAGVDVVISGKVIGNIVSRGRLTVTASGSVHGNVIARSLIVQEGGVLCGQCELEQIPVSEKEENSSKQDKQEKPEQKNTPPSSSVQSIPDAIANNDAKDNKRSGKSRQAG